ncbi:MupA/Atu3671 family FMN-dependent luciferase-like monooxygenase [Roseicitreum antarcticum]|uniref:Natural product biosynthesis luciferase-like monooxygenase domain-containing protein n=1 Tax=Roseicitreum antarcticum TaxID=564137 RepID=A0A1H2RYA6_9RHOB|nr:MupA/Atu3671 family FMN-dependent luciferase-like monooxygenase [Roseicitreum antarcticum]SDW24472.1 natural product biosynthesis luciferase-like monooxygenase domain-containing protein [Roseicitreum antarcticum]
MSRFSGIAIGEDTLLIQCGEILLDKGHDLRAVVSVAPDVVHWAVGRGLRVIAPGAGLADRLADDLTPGGFDWLFSIANLTLIPQTVLTQARRGAVNFHDGPLPRYAGLNAPVWALLNGEAQHGITWHVMEDGVDTGDILEQRRFDIDPQDTALTLNTKCYAAAMEGFTALVDQLASGTQSPRAQDMAARQVFRRDDRPALAGRLEFSRDTAALIRMVRALDHGRYWNPVTLPKLDLGGRVVCVGAAEVAQGQGAPGTVLAADDDAVVVATADGAVRLSGLICPMGLPVVPGALVAPGDMLSTPDADLTDAMARVVVGEGGWRRALVGFEAAVLPLASAPATAEMATFPLDLPADMPPARLLAAFGALAGQMSGATRVDIAYRDAQVAQSAAAATGYIAPWVPLGADLGATVAQAERQMTARLALIARAPGYATDLIARDPALTPPEVPHLAAVADGAQVEGAVVTMALDRRELTIDLARLPRAEAERMAARLAHLAQHLADDIPLNDLPLLPESEQDALLHGLNDTARFYDRLCIHTAFEAQVERTPDALALVFEGQSLSYADLNARANRVAHVLRGMGVVPDTPVALCTRRAPELLIGALGILKAGGAYVPLDPAYPADRLAHYLTDSAAPVIVTQRALVDDLPVHSAELLVLDTDTRLDAAPVGNLAAAATPDHLAYLIYTSGSTGVPKGVMVEHGNVANFFAGMDDRIDHAAGGVWLAVTSLSFDISVLELFWTLSRGFKLVLTSDADRGLVSGGAVQVSDRKMDFSLMYWGNDDGIGPKKYELLLEGAKFADTHGFCAVWTPERHFHAFGGPYPNPSVTGAAVAAVTKNIGVRAGSCVVPLHHPARIAEDWAVIDNLTNGRAGLAVASGWQPDDFVLRPENTPPHNRQAMLDSIDILRRLWRGEAVEFPRADGTPFAVVTQPRPVSKVLPIWVTTAGNPQTWVDAGRMGANVLTHLLGQSVAEVGEKIKAYHQALRDAGHNPADFTVTLMLHSFVARNREHARDVARGPMKDYLKAAAALVKQYAWAFPAFKKPQGVANPMDIDLGTLSADELDGILEFAFTRYFDDSGLFGTVEDCVARVEELKAIGVTEVACLIDYGIAPEQVLEGLYPLAEVLRRANQPSDVAADDFSIAAQIRRHGVTHLQCTPSMARMFTMNDDARAALARVPNLLVGGEALPGTLAHDLSGLTGHSVLNMYGPTETTIWSSVCTTTGGDGVVGIGTPIANTQLYVLNDAGQPVPPGVPGELWIGGDGVTRGYWQRPDLTAERFPANPFGTGRMYRTGDLVRRDAFGGIDFLGRIDGQVKLRGYRIELGEIESALEAVPGITQAVVIAREDTPGDVRLVAYHIGTPTTDLRDALARNLPAHMIPAHFVALDRMPLTPNKKVDRKALPAPRVSAPTQPVQAIPIQAAGASDTRAQIAGVWKRVLGVADVAPGDSFFALGGHSLLAVQAHRDLRDALGLPGLSITDIFRFPVLADLAKHVDLKLRPSVAPPSAQSALAQSGSAQSGSAQSRSAQAAPDSGAAGNRLDAMSKRRAMRAQRQGQGV